VVLFASHTTSYPAKWNALKAREKYPAYFIRDKGGGYEVRKAILWLARLGWPTHFRTTWFYIVDGCRQMVGLASAITIQKVSHSGCQKTQPGIVGSASSAVPAAPARHNAPEWLFCRERGFWPDATRHAPREGSATTCHYSTGRKRIPDAVHAAIWSEAAGSAP
jgi:hypothetical protein